MDYVNFLPQGERSDRRAPSLCWRIMRSYALLLLPLCLPSQASAQSINDLMRIIPPLTQPAPPVYRAPPPVYQPPVYRPPPPVYQPPVYTPPATAQARPAQAPRPQISSTQIAEMQQMLADLGYDAGIADGVAGRKTMTAMNAFQEDFGLPVSGTPTPQNLKTLRAVHARSAGNDTAHAMQPTHPVDTSTAPSQTAPLAHSTTHMPVAAGGATTSASILDGTWRGRYTCSHETNLTLILEHTSNGHIKADFILQVASGQRIGAIGHFPMHGNFHTDTGEFALQPGTPIIMPPGWRAAPLKGKVFQNQAGEIQITARPDLSTCKTFQLSRVAPVSVAQAYKDYQAQIPPAAPKIAHAPTATADAGLCNRIVSWANQLEDHYPFPGPEYTRGVPSAKLIRPLFTDERFKPVVGKAFTDLDRQERHTVARNIARCLHNAKLDARTRAHKHERLADAHVYASDHKAVAEFVSVARTDHAWRQSTWAEIQARQPDEESYDEIVAFTQELSKRQSDMWPGEQAAFRKEIARKRKEAAEPALVSRVNKLTAAPVDTGLLDRLTRQRKQSQLWSDNTADVAKREALRLEQKQESVLAELISQEKELFKQRGKGLEALAWGLRWDIVSRTRYDEFTDHPSVIALNEQYMALREQDLRDVRKELMEMFKAGTDISALERESEKYLNRRIDAKSEEGRLLLAALDDRQKEIQLETVERERRMALALEASKYSARENKLMAMPGQLPLTVPASYSEPDDEEIGLALMREMTAGGGRMLSPTSVEIGVPPFDILMPIQLDSTKVEKESCKRMEESLAYTCTFRQYLMMSFPSRTYDFFRIGGGNEFFEGLLAKFKNAVNNAEPGLKAHVFVLTTSGWRSPTIRQASIKATLDTYAETFSNWPTCNLVSVGNQLRCE